MGPVEELRLCLPARFRSLEPFNILVMRTPLLRFIALFFCTLGLLSSDLEACTRVVYQGPNGNVMTARSMDWKTEIPANWWVFPRGMKRSGNAGPNSVEWTALYGSVATSSWDLATSDGMNEKGLVGNLLWLAESQFPELGTATTGQRTLAVSLWLQYVLDQCATVEEAVRLFSKGDVAVITSVIPGTSMVATVHLSVSDASGDNAIFEYIGGKLEIHHDRKYATMTNSPVFEEQMAINGYWKGIPGTVALPGTNRAADRFVRASYYIQAIPQTDNTRVALASVFGVIRNCSVPLGISSETEPNISSTRWRTVADHRNLVYYFDNVLEPNVVWVDLKKLDFSPKAKPKKLALEGPTRPSGECSASFVPTAPFVFAGV